MRHLFFAIALVSAASPALATARPQGPVPIVVPTGKQFSMDQRGADYTIVKVGTTPLSRQTARDVHGFVGSCTKAIDAQMGPVVVESRIRSRAERQILAGHCVDFFLGTAVGRDPSFEGVSIVWRR